MRASIRPRCSLDGCAVPSCFLVDAPALCPASAASGLPMFPRNFCNKLAAWIGRRNTHGPRNWSGVAPVRRTPPRSGTHVSPPSVHRTSFTHLLPTGLGARYVTRERGCAGQHHCRELMPSSQSSCHAYVPAAPPQSSISPSPPTLPFKSHLRAFGRLRLELSPRSRALFATTRRQRILLSSPNLAFQAHSAGSDTSERASTGSAEALSEPSTTSSLKSTARQYH